MTDLFSKILNMSLTGCVVILLVIAARLALKKAPKIYSYALWAVVLFRLLCPVSLSLPVSVLDVFQPEVTQSEGITSSVSYIPAAYVSDTTQQPGMVRAEENLNAEAPSEATKPTVSIRPVLACIWLIGVAVMVLKSAVQYVQLRRRLIGTMRCGRDLFIADHITSPFVMGILDPKIYLPSAIPAKERRYIIAHERHHIRRCDHIVKLLAYGALCLHWFNPLVWAAFVLAGKDMEMSCDEAVVRRYGPHIRADYSASLLRLATGQRIFSGMPIAFGEGDTKGRILNMAKWKKPKVWVSVISCVLCIAILAACAVNPEQEQSENILDDFKLTLPAGFTLEASEDGSYAISDGEQTVGGLAKRKLPDFSIITAEMDAWVKAVGVPEAYEDNMAYMIESGGNTIEAWYRPEIPDQEEADRLDVTHYLYPTENDVYDLWLYTNRIAQEAKWYILERATVVGSGFTTFGSEDYNELPVDLVTEFHVEVPEGFSLINGGDGTRHIEHDMSLVGGIVKYAAPDVKLEGNMAEWVKALGVPEIQDGVMSYMMEDYGGPYAFQATFFNEFVDEQERTDTEVTHYFFIDGDIVYDLWFYNAKVDDAAKKEILNSAGFFAEPENTAETTAASALGEPVQGSDVVVDLEEPFLTQCRAVLDMVQSGSCQLAIEQENGTTDSLWSRTDFYQSDGSWLRITDIDPETEDIADGEEWSARIAYMYADGVRYSNEGMGGNAYSDISWKEGGSFDDGAKPWLASFQWNDNVVYVDTLTDENGHCVMLRVDEHYAGREDYAPNYFVNFNFDAEWNFRNVKVQVNLFQENEFTDTESIVSLDAETIAAEIDKEYQRAIG